VIFNTLMHTLPNPLTLTLIAGIRCKTNHFGYVEFNKMRTLCKAKVNNKLSDYVVIKEGKLTCQHCLKRLNYIYDKIEKEGYEWVCFAHYLEPEERTYKIPYPKNVVCKKIIPRIKATKFSYA